MLDVEVKVGSIYRHFKGHIYEVIAIGKDSEDLSLKVVYRNIDTKEVWIRDKKEFLSKVDKDKYPNINQEYRFELVSKN